jgi:hypothetical protein
MRFPEIRESVFGLAISITYLEIPAVALSGWEAERKNMPTVREIALGVARQRIPCGVMADVIDELWREQHVRC